MGYVHRDPKIWVEIEQLYKENREALEAYVKNIIRDDSVAEDIVQETFFEACKQYKLVKKHPNKRGWLFRTARYKILEFDRRLRNVETTNIEDETIVAEDGEEEYLNAEIAQTLKASLTEDELAYYYQYFICGYTVEEMAKHEGISANNMRVRLTRIRKKLMERIDLLLWFCCVILGRMF